MSAQVLIVWVTECSSTLRVPKFLRAQMPKYRECPSALSLLRTPKCASVFQVLWSAFWVSNFPLSVFQVKKVWNITRNGLLNIFVEFLKTFQNPYFYITLIVFSFLGNKMYTFYHILLARCNHSKGFEKLFLIFLLNFRKLIVRDSGALFPTNVPCGFHVETTWKRSFPRHFHVESTWCVCRVVSKLVLLWL